MKYFQVNYVRYIKKSNMYNARRKSALSKLIDKVLHGIIESMQIVKNRKIIFLLVYYKQEQIIIFNCYFQNFLHINIFFKLLEHCGVFWVMVHGY